MSAPTPSVIQFIGYKNSGKTTLVCAMAERLTALGLCVGAIKHDAHEFQMDTPGTDTWQLGAAGAAKVAIASPGQTAMLERYSSTLDELIGRMSDMDVIVVEGFKQALYPKFVLLRGIEDLDLMTSSSNIVAAVSWVKLAPESFSCPVIGIHEVEQVWELLMRAVRSSKQKDGEDSC